MKRPILSHINELIKEKERALLLLYSNLAIIKNLKKNNQLYCRSSLSFINRRLTRLSKKSFKVDLITDKGVILREIESPDKVYVRWSEFIYEKWR